VSNRDLEATWTYHNSTKHSYQSVRSDAHSLDWQNQPLAFKVYPTLDPVPLPRDVAPSQVPALRAVAVAGPPSDGPCVPDLRTLAQLLYYSAGITKRRAYPGGEMYYRAASCTGALYHIDLYLVCGDLPGLEAGVYHFGAHDFALRRLRQGDFRGEVVRATSGEPAVAATPAVIALTSTYWRNAWKYQARTYRHCFWDSGTILANLLAVAAARELPTRIVAGFIDDSLNRLLGLDDQREVTLGLVALGHAPTASDLSAPLSGRIEPLAPETTPLSRTEVDYPAIRAMHAASSLDSEAQVAAWRGRTPQLPLPEPSGHLFPLPPANGEEAPDASIERVIVRRGSTRRFAREPIAFDQLATMLRAATRGIAADFLEPQEAMLNQLYLIVHAVDGLLGGAYVYHRERDALELLKDGDFRAEAGYLGLEQALPADAAVDVFFLADLRPVLTRFGNRGYRAAQLEAAIMGGKLYLAAYAQRLGATGLTFYDDDVTAFFSPHAEGKSVMFLVALGRPARRRSA
jgi:SagB-type dehydrogenase family enzyme